MLPVKVSEIVRLVNGQLVNGSAEYVVRGVSTDSRSLSRGDFFIPLPGDKYNGHEFILEALKGGACGFFTRRWNEQIKITVGPELDNETIVIKVPDTLKALQDLAKNNRQQLDVDTVGITGSTGKTSTKDMLASILSEDREVVSTEKNYNNEIGVPLTVLQANGKTEAIVVEMAMRGLGQIRELAKIARPTIGLVTNVGKTHFELLGSEESIAQAKSELVEAIPSDGTVVLNNDDLWTEKLKIVASAGHIVTYGLSNSADLTARQIMLDSFGKSSFELISGDQSIFINLPVLGRHNVYNALAASAAAITLGCSLANIKRGLEKCTLSEMRMQIFTTVDGITILNDAYNASPASMRAALTTLRDIANESRKIAILGDMLELGKLSDISHFEIGELAQTVGIDFLITVGQKSRRIAEGALGKGMDVKKIFSCTNPDEVNEILTAKVKSGDVVLIKASRGMQLEKVVNFLF